MSFNMKFEPHGESDIEDMVNTRSKGKQRVITPDQRRQHNNDASHSLPTPSSSYNGDSEGDSTTDSNIAAPLQALNVQSKTLIETIKKLEQLNIVTTLPSLPKFIVVGDQSAGKSSIVEALCNVSIPRDAGTCTRCPFKITTSGTTDSQAWQCKVTLQSKYFYDSHSSGKLFSRWVESEDQEVDTCSFALVKDKSELGDILRRAQHALLCPRDAPGTYANLETPLPPNTQVMFSPNLICLDIQGPSLPELSFYDLPGSINVVENEKDQYLVAFIEKLVKSYIRDEKALIMLAVAADGDTENSTTFKFIRECEAKKRCLGVLTKPDLMPPVKAQHVARILDGQAYSLGKGWYVTKQPSQQELREGVTQETARERENAFFATGIWNQQLSSFHSRFSITNLQDALSSELRKHILENLGDIIARVQTRLDKVNDDLSRYRVKDGSPFLTVVDVSRRISDAISAHMIDGSIVCCKFRPEFKQLQVKFREKLLALHPELDPSTPGHKAKLSVVELSDDEDDDTPATPAPPRKRKAPPLSTNAPPHKKVKAERSTPVAVSQAVVKAKLTITEIESIRNTHASTAIHGQHSEAVTEVIIKNSMKGWDNELNKLLESLDDKLTDMLITVADYYLQQYSSCPLSDKLKEALVEFTRPIINTQKAEIRTLLAREQHKPVTVINTEPHMNHALDILQKKRKAKRALEFVEIQEGNEDRLFSEAERKKKLAEFNQNPPADPHRMAIEALVLPFAYYNISAGRFVDNIAQHCEYDLFRVIKEGLNNSLLTRLGANDSAACEALLVENSEVERNRAQLSNEKERLQVAVAELSALH